MNTKQSNTDASGKGEVGKFKVPYPSLMYRYTQDDIDAVLNVMQNAPTMSQGQYLEKFQNDFRTFTGATHAFAVSSGTAALQLASQLCRLGPGDEVIIPAYTFCATAIPLGASGAKIVWADIDPESLTVSPEDIASKITPRTRAIVAVHLLGMPADMDSILAIAAQQGLTVIEDCAQAPGALYKGRRVGSIGDLGCFSFNSAKNMTTLGEGGMLTVRNDEQAAMVPGLRHNGVRRFPDGRSNDWVPAMSNLDIDIDGIWPTKFCLGEAQCALGSALLRRLDTVNNRLRQQGETLRRRLSSTPEIVFPQDRADQHRMYHCCVAQFDGRKVGGTRDDFISLMTKKYGIRLIVQYYPLYRYPLFEKMGFGKAHCPNLEKFWPNSFSFPWWLGMPEETMDYVVHSTVESIESLKTTAVSVAHRSY